LSVVIFFYKYTAPVLRYDLSAAARNCQCFAFYAIEEANPENRQRARSLFKTLLATLASLILIFMLGCKTQIDNAVEQQKNKNK